MRATTITYGKLKSRAILDPTGQRLWVLFLTDFTLGKAIN